MFWLPARVAPKLLDFGISKLLLGDAPLTERNCVDAEWPGRPLTLSYAAPEHILGLPISVAPILRPWLDAYEPRQGCDRTGD